MTLGKLCALLARLGRRRRYKAICLSPARGFPMPQLGHEQWVLVFVMVVR